MPEITQQELENAVEKINEIAKNDYLKFSAGSNDFLVSLDGGRKYAKMVVTKRGSKSVFGFIARTDTTTPDGRFIPAGSLLKSASYKAPALNFSRGHIDDLENAQIRWTGI